MSGWDATRLLKASPETGRIPVLMLTGHVFVDAERRAVDAGVDVFLRKPCLPDVLHEQVIALLDRAAAPNGKARARRARARTRVTGTADSTRQRGAEAPRQNARFAVRPHHSS
jgi:CheY-like chemotaxis protein